MPNTEILGLTREQIRAALSFLLKNADPDNRSYWRQRDTTDCVLSEHPFGLDITLPSPPGDGWKGNQSVRLIAWPGYTDASVDAMVLLLRHELDGYSLSTAMNPIRLRIVRAQVREGQHYVYFEFISYLGSFICGGCTDFSGEGGYGRTQLETIFGFLSALYEVPLEDVFIPAAQAEPAMEKMKRRYDECMRERSESA